MLSKIREKTQGIIATLILSFIAIPFVLWGTNSYFERGASNAIAKVNGTEISQQTYQRALENVSANDPQRAQQRAVKDMVLRSLIDQTLLVSEAEERGYRLSNLRLGQIIRDVPYFHRDGRFDQATYQDILRRQGMHVSEFETRMRQDNLATQVQQGLIQSAFVTEADVAAYVRLLKQERQISYAFIKPETFLSKITLSPEDLEQYYQANQEAFRTPEAVRVQYVLLSAADIGKQQPPTEEELRQAYEADIARYVTPEKRRASHILLNVVAGASDDAVRAAQKRAEELAVQARSGNFAVLAKQHSDDKDSAAKGGDLGEIARGVLPTELENAIYAMKAGEVSQPIRTQYGFHIAKVTAVTPSKRQSFESVKAELLEQVRTRKSEERFYEVGERFRNLVYEHPDSLEQVAQTLGLKIETTEWFTRSGGPGIASFPRFASAAFEPEVLRQERNSDVIELQPQVIAALRVTEHRPPSVQPLAAVKAKVERLLKEQRAREQARAAAEEWTQKLATSGSLSDLARTLDAKVEMSKKVTRDQPSGVDRRLLQQVFAAGRPNERPVYGYVDLASQGYAVYALEAVRDVDPAKVDAPTKEKARQQLVQQRGADYYTSYREGLRQDASIKIYNEQL